MSTQPRRSCAITGKRTTTGNNVSHAKRRTKRKFRPNLHKKRFYLTSQKRYITLRISAKGMRTIDKCGGIEAYIEKHGNDILREQA